MLRCIVLWSKSLWSRYQRWRRGIWNTCLFALDVRSSYLLLWSNVSSRNARMNARMHKWMHEWMHEWVREWMHEWISECTHECTNESTSECTNECSLISSLGLITLIQQMLWVCWPNSTTTCIQKCLETAESLKHDQSSTFFQTESAFWQTGVMREHVLWSMFHVLLVEMVFESPLKIDQ